MAAVRKGEIPSNTRRLEAYRVLRMDFWSKLNFFIFYGIFAEKFAKREKTYGN